MTNYERTIDRFRKAARALNAMTAKRYPKGSEVTVMLSTISVKGVVYAHVALCPDLIAILLENGNVWNYPVEKVAPATAKETK